MHYWPLVLLPDARPFAVEALLVDQVPMRGVASPMTLSDVASHAGIPESIGSWLLDRVLAELATWDAEVPGPDLRLICVRLTLLQLEALSVADTLADVLARHDVAPSRLCLEITDAAAALDLPTSRRTLNACRDLGVELALGDPDKWDRAPDEMPHLVTSIVRIDASSVPAGDAASFASLRDLVDAWHAKGLRVLADGVDTPWLLSLVSRVPCDLAQGDYLARPMPREALRRWWQEDTRRSH